MLHGTQKTIRAVHRALLRRPLPQKLSLYLHSTGGYERQLDELLQFFKAKGYQFKNPSEFMVSTGETLLLSLDDNYSSWLQLLPIFERHKVRATFFVNSWPFRDRVSASEVHGYLQRLGLRDAELAQETTLSTAELREIAAAGHTIGAHTHTHPVLTSLPRTAAEEEIRISKEELESLLGCPVNHFAYPFGMRRHFSQSLRSYCLSIGFATVANAIPGMQFASPQADNLYRSVWHLGQPLAFNLDNMRIDGRLFATLTGRSAVGGDLL
jgi:peptidoglycan/xylan/chitin deacetylase (PgdA/CDA1 family)